MIESRVLKLYYFFEAYVSRGFAIYIGAVFISERRQQIPVRKSPSSIKKVNKIVYVYILLL